MEETALIINYPAIFNYDEYDASHIKYGIAISFPDVPSAYSCARDDAEGIKMALDVLQLCLYGVPVEKLPPPTPHEKIKMSKNEKVFVIPYDPNAPEISAIQIFQSD